MFWSKKEDGSKKAATDQSADVKTQLTDITNSLKDTIYLFNLELQKIKEIDEPKRAH